MQTLIDGALRLSVLSSINSKMLTGIKIKANTFGPGLADLVPTIWKPNYLWVSDKDLRYKGIYLPSNSLYHKERVCYRLLAGPFANLRLLQEPSPYP
jgi:hypothetical protein